MLRRTKAAVAAELPPKQSRWSTSSCIRGTAGSIRPICSGNGRRCSGLIDDLDHNRFTVLRSLTLLRRLSLDPALVDEAHSGVPAAKVEVLVGDLAEIVQEGHQALVFSQFTSFLGRIRTRLDEAGISYAYLDGRTRHRDRVVERFRIRGGFGLPDQPEGRGIRTQPDRGQLLLRARSVVEPGDRGSGRRPDASDRADQAGHGLPAGGQGHHRGEGDGPQGPQGASSSARCSATTMAWPAPHLTAEEIRGLIGARPASDQCRCPLFAMARSGQSARFALDTLETAG